MNQQVVFFLAALFLLSALPQPARADAVDDYVQLEIKRQKIPGLSLAVVKNGKVIKTAGYGLANIELNVAARPESVYKIGSVSKQFIATGIMLLVRDGKIKVDDPISKYLDGAPELWKDITIHHLLTHTSGILRESPGYVPHRAQPDADVVKAAYASPLRFQPGEKYEYCNVGYFILAEIIRKVTDKPWGEYLHNRVFAPLEMKATRTTDVASIVPHRASGYALRDGQVVNEVNWPSLRPSGAFLSNVLDLARWEAALHAGEVLSAPLRDQMWKPVMFKNGKEHGYGYGWELDYFRHIRTISHGGTLSGFRSVFVRYPEFGVTVIVLCNLESANVNILANGVATKFIPAAELSALEPKAVPDTTVDKQIRGLLQDIAQGKKEFPQATEALGNTLSRMPESSRKAIEDYVSSQSACEFLRDADMQGKGMQRLGSPITSVWQYRFTARGKTRFGTFYMSADKVALFEVTDF